MRCPRRFRAVHQGEFIATSLRTDSESEAAALVAAVKRQVLQELEARLAGNSTGTTRENFESIIALAKSHGVRLRRAEDIAADSNIKDMLLRIERAMTFSPRAEGAHVAALLGGFDVPGTTMTEFAREMHKMMPGEVENKNLRQIRIWNAKWLRAAAALAEAVGADKPIKDLTEQDAFELRRFWEKRVTTKNDRVTTAYANKHIGYISEMIKQFYRSIEIDKFTDPFAGKRLDKQAWESKQKPKRKNELPPAWIRDKLLNREKFSNLNQEAYDITVICAETGCRQSEIFDIPPSAIKLDSPTPHFSIKVEGGDGEIKRDVKTASSIRDVPLVGAALDAMRRNPDGFPRYRGKASYYNTVNKFIKDNDLFPEGGEDYSIGGLRHSFETRMFRAGISNDDRAFIMGHSIKKLRGREVYGNETTLKLKALFTEMIAFETETFKPRRSEEINEEINQILKEEGFRV